MYDDTPLHPNYAIKNPSNRPNDTREAFKLFKNWDLNKDGKISFDEFYHHLKTYLTDFVTRAAESAEQREQCSRTNYFSSDKVSENLPDVLSNDYDKLDKLSNHYDILEKLSNYYDILEKKIPMIKIY